MSKWICAGMVLSVIGGCDLQAIADMVILQDVVNKILQYI